MTWLTGIKYVALVALGYWIFRAGEDHANVAAKAAQAAQLTQVVKTYEQQLSASQEANAAQQKVVDAYDAIKDAPDPVSIGLATRVLERACPSGGGDLPQASTVAGGTQTPPASGGRDSGSQSSGLGSKIQAVIDACIADDRQLETVIKIAPQ